jgi:hypothetical protein
MMRRVLCLRLTRRQSDDTAALWNREPVDAAVRQPPSRFLAAVTHLAPESALSCFTAR